MNICMQCDRCGHRSGAAFDLRHNKYLCTECHDELESKRKKRAKGKR